MRTTTEATAKSCHTEVNSGLRWVNPVCCSLTVVMLLANKWHLRFHSHFCCCHAAQLLLLLSYLLVSLSLLPSNMFENLDLSSKGTFNMREMRALLSNSFSLIRKQVKVTNKDTKRGEARRREPTNSVVSTQLLPSPQTALRRECNSHNSTIFVYKLRNIFLRIIIYHRILFALWASVCVSGCLC